MNPETLLRSNLAKYVPRAEEGIARVSVNLWLTDLTPVQTGYVVVYRFMPSIALIMLALLSVLSVLIEAATCMLAVAVRLM